MHVQIFFVMATCEHITSYNNIIIIKQLVENNNKMKKEKDKEKGME
jgi:hypothetical protein